MVILHEGQRDGRTEPKKSCEKSIFLARDKGTERHSTKSVRYSFIWAGDKGTEGQAAFFGLSPEDRGTDPKNCVKSQLFLPGTKGQRDTDLNLSDTALFWQGTQRQRDRLCFLA